MNCTVIVCTFTVFIELEQRKISVTMLTEVSLKNASLRTKKKNWRHGPELMNVAKTKIHLLVQKRKYVALQTYEIQTTFKKFRALKGS
jgi:hypothetical protein